MSMRNGVELGHLRRFWPPKRPFLRVVPRCGRNSTLSMVTGTVSVIQGGQFGHGFVSAGLGTLAGPTINARVSSPGGQIIAHALVGGSILAVTGGKFANGAATAAFRAALAVGGKLKAQNSNDSADSSNESVPRGRQGRSTKIARLAIAEGAEALEAAPESGFGSHEEAARFAKSKLQVVADKYDTEFGVRIFLRGRNYLLGSVASDGVICRLSNPCTVNLVLSRNASSMVIGDFHTHPSNHGPSDADIGLAVGYARGYMGEWHSYVSTPDGSLCTFKGARVCIIYRGRSNENAVR